jgi:hypothetical protein
VVGGSRTSPLSSGHSPSFSAYTPGAASPSPRYHNSFRAQQADESKVTTIDSRIDDLLGDSLNIEEKDGRVYVHFQSKFLLS